ncbi:MAG: oligosaccharyl transferase, archaeosortase A system-associated [Dehalococcoidales bacterium]|nr:oligosaccharyl transferase, archaeosortase A system-associated [Dehalococcoidales bacterium]
MRVIFRLEAVFPSDWVRFAETDPWYHIRLIENLMHHFPQNITFDPYTFFPFGRDVFFAPLFDWILGSIIWIIGLGSPSQHTLEVTAAYFPAVTGALVTVPVFFIAKELFNKKTGLICAALIAILPGNFFARSLLGVTDHHIVEVFFSTLSILFLIFALKESRRLNLDFSHIRNRDWKVLRKPLLYSLLFGFFLGVYMLSWVGGLLILLIIFAFFVIQFIIDHLSGKSTDYLCLTGVPAFLLAMIMVIPVSTQGSLEKLHPVSLAAGIIVFVLLGLFSLWMEHKKIRRLYFLVVLMGIAAAGILGLYFLANPLFSTAVAHLKIFLPQGDALTITEVQPLFRNFSLGELTQSRVWGFFTTGLFFVPVSLGLLIYYSVKRARAEVIFFLVWTILMLLAMLGQNRFSYYFALNVALCGGYISWKIYEGVRSILRLLGLEKVPQETMPVSSTAKKRKKGKKSPQRTTDERKWRPNYASVVIAVLICFFLVFFPNFTQARSIASGVPAPDDDWHDTLIWMKENTPEPFLSADYYYSLYEKPGGKRFEYPESAYGVMSWWDYGHWITAIAHRIPNSNAFQDGASVAGRYFTNADVDSANKLLDRSGSKYIIIDKDMTILKFSAMAEWAGVEFPIGNYYQRNESGTLEKVRVYYAEYYQSMCSRLYNFQGSAVIPRNTTRVISFVEKTDLKGTRYKEIISNEVYPTYEEALEACKQSPGSIIAGTDPFISPVPLEKLEQYQLVYQSPTVLGKDGDRMITSVEVFEYKP